MFEAAHPCIEVACLHRLVKPASRQHTCIEATNHIKFTPAPRQYYIPDVNPVIAGSADQAKRL
eukprot:1141144-Pelagomonas_calceolata.AAC.1